jgi:hypothetical protein
MEKKSVIQRGKMIALAAVAATAIGCATVPTVPTPMSPTYLTGKSIDDKFANLTTEQQDAFVKTMNNLGPWDNVLLARYAPIDGMLRDLSSFYSIDYKGFLETILAQSGLDPTAGPKGIQGFGQITSESEKWARDLFNNKRLSYNIPGQKLANNASDPYTNLVLSSILFRKAEEEKVLDLDAVLALYSNGFNGVSKNENGLYSSNATGADMVKRAKSFDAIADKLMIFSWISQNHPELAKNIEDANLRKIIEANNGTYDGKVAYEGMIEFLNGISTNKKYIESDQKMFRNEATSIAGWIKNYYGN